MRKIKTTASLNKKVRNATPQVCDGIKFRSKLEVYCYTQLQKYGIQAEYEQYKYVIFNGFTYNTEKIRPITYTPDFVGKTFIIECKGMMNQTFPLKWKMFKYFCISNDMQHVLYLPRNQKQIDVVIKDILK